MSERMDPEDVKAFAHRSAERLAEEVRRFGGTVISVMGDAIMAVFGAPIAHEDDPERAVRAAFAMRVCAFADGTTDPLRLHIGINTGEVMAGLVGPAERCDYTVMGDTTNTAARLMAAAPADGVLVGEETYRATRRLVRYRELPPIAARGKERPVPAWEALDVAPLPEARPLGTAPLVGRAEELALLSGTWTRVSREARPHLVTVLGEPGIGKSRLVAELERDSLADALVLHGRCLPYGEALGYWAFATALKEAAAITADDDAERARAKLADLVTEVAGYDSEADPIEVARHLLLLGGLDAEDDRAAPAVDQRTLHASARRFLEALARRRPLCLLLEDIHWADDALLDLVEFVAARVHEAPLLIVAQARPELLEKRPAWGRAVHASTALWLEPLDAGEGRDLVTALCRERGLPEVVAEQVGRGAGGNPLFAEELVATVAERGGAAGIPSAIKALISARLDLLPTEERGVLQLAAVVGKHFWEGGLRVLVAPGDVAEHLEVLEQKDLIRAQPSSRFRGDREYAFKHDLICDVAYETLPRAERRPLHGRVADWIEDTQGERVEELLDLLAHHAVQADQQERAIDYLTRAAERARRAAAHREEAALLAQATAIAERLGASELAADLRARRGKAFADIALWADARGNLEAALQGLAPDHRARRAEILIDLAGVCLWGLDVPSARRAATEALALADELDRADLATRASAWIAACDGSDGALTSAIDGYRRALARAGELGLELSTSQTVLYSVAMYWAGQLEAAVQRSHEDIQLARRAHDTWGLLTNLGNRVMYLAGSGRYDEAERVLEEARAFTRDHGGELLLARAIVMAGGAHLEVFDFAGAEALAEEGRELARSTNWMPTVVSGGIDLLLNYARRGEPGPAEWLVDEVAEVTARTAGFHGWLWRLRLAEARAEMALARGDAEEALRWADDAIAQCRAKGRVKYHAIGLGTRASALAALGRTREAIADLRHAVELARPVGDPALFLRPATTLLSLDGDDALAAEARAAVERITAALPDPELRRRFVEAEPVRRLASLTP